MNGMKLDLLNGTLTFKNEIEFFFWAIQDKPPSPRVLRMRNYQKM